MLIKIIILFSLSIVLCVLCAEPNVCSKLEWYLENIGGRKAWRQRMKEYCCEGYTEDLNMDGGSNTNKSIVCKPVCEPACPYRQYCKTPGVCACLPGYRDDINATSPTGERCTPICNECQAEYCTEPEVCSCMIGLEPIYGTCTSGCARRCINAHCSATGKCVCHEGYWAYNYNTCKPYNCSTDCGNGYCAGPDRCKCHPDCHEVKQSLSDAFICEPTCVNCTGECVAPNYCRHILNMTATTSTMSTASTAYTTTSPRTYTTTSPRKNTTTSPITYTTTSPRTLPTTAVTTTERTTTVDGNLEDNKTYKEPKSNYTEYNPDVRSKGNATVTTWFEKYWTILLPAVAVVVALAVIFAIVRCCCRSNLCRKKRDIPDDYISETRSSAQQVYYSRSGDTTEYKYSEVKIS